MKQEKEKFLKEGLFKDLINLPKDISKKITNKIQLVLMKITNKIGVDWSKEELFKHLETTRNELYPVLDMKGVEMLKKATEQLEKEIQTGKIKNGYDYLKRLQELDPKLY